MNRLPLFLLLTLLLLPACAKPDKLDSLPVDTPISENNLPQATTIATTTVPTVMVPTAVVLTTAVLTAPTLTDSQDATASPTLLAKEPVVIYQRSGGFAGLSEEWRIYPDGRIEGPGNKMRAVPPKEVRALLATIEANEFADLKASYIPPDVCCDRFTYTITVRSGDQATTVSTIDASPDQPAQLTAVLEAIDRLIASQ